MRSKKLDSVRIPWQVWDKARKRCADEEYRSMARYITGLMLRDLVAPQKHYLVQAIANSDPDLQDDLLDLFLNHPPETVRQLVIQAARLRGPSKPG